MNVTAIDPKKIAEWEAQADELQNLVLAPDGKDRENAARGVLLTDNLVQAGVALLAERKELLALLREVEWRGGFEHSDAYCPICGADKDDGKHAPDCRLAAFLG